MCKEEHVNFFSLTSALVKKKIDTLQNLLVCTARQGKLVKKIEKFRGHSGLVLVMTHCNGAPWVAAWVFFFVVRCVIVLLATNKTCQGKTRQRKFVVHTHEHMNIVNNTCQGKLAGV